MPAFCVISWIRVDILPAQSALKSWACKWMHRFGSLVFNRLTETIQIIRQYFITAGEGISRLIAGDENQDEFVQVMNFFHEVSAKYEDIMKKIGPMSRTIGFLERYDIRLSDVDIELYHSISPKMETLKGELQRTRKVLAPRVIRQAARIQSSLDAFKVKLAATLENFYDSEMLKRTSDNDAAVVLRITYG